MCSLVVVFDNQVGGVRGCGVVFVIFISVCGDGVVWGWGDCVYDFGDLVVLGIVEVVDCEECY